MLICLPQNYKPIQTLVGLYLIVICTVSDSSEAILDVLTADLVAFQGFFLMLIGFCRRSEKREFSCYSIITN